MPRVLPSHVREIVALDDAAVLRNLRITQAYHDITLDLRDLVGPRNVCWSGFGCWASKQAGAFIRGEELPSVLRRLADDPELDLLAGLELIVDGVAAHVALGNRIVFAEIGDAFARFTSAFEGSTRPDPDALKAFLAGFSEGPSIPDVLERGPAGELVARQRGGQSVLRRGLELLHAAMFEPDPKRRAELVLLSSGMFGLHEQTRLQPYIVGAQDSPLPVSLGSWLTGPNPARARVAQGMRTLVHDACTELIMTMRVPGETLHLGRDLEAPLDVTLWPGELERLDHPELVALTVALGTYETRKQSLDWTDRVEDWFDGLFAKLGLGQREAQGTGARDWSSLQQRMRFIFELFRSRQQHPTMFEPPFAPDQEHAIRRGEVPKGEL